MFARAVRIAARAPLAQLAASAPARLAAPVRALCSDSDFKPRQKPFVAAGCDVQAQIQKEIRENKVVLFMKGVPAAPMCGFSNQVVQARAASLKRASPRRHHARAARLTHAASHTAHRATAHGHRTQVLKAEGVAFKGINVLADPDVRDGIKEFSSWPTIPQLYVAGEFLGGCDTTVEMFKSGELGKLLEAAGAKKSAQ